MTEPLWSANGGSVSVPPAVGNGCDDEVGCTDGYVGGQAAPVMPGVAVGVAAVPGVAVGELTVAGVAVGELTVAGVAVGEAPEAGVAVGEAADVAVAVAPGPAVGVAVPEIGVGVTPPVGDVVEPAAGTLTPPLQLIKRSALSAKTAAETPRVSEVMLKQTFSSLSLVQERWEMLERHRQEAAKRYPTIRIFSYGTNFLQTISSGDRR